MSFMEMEKTDNLFDDDVEIVQQSTIETLTDVSNSKKRRKKSNVWKEFTELDSADFPDKRERAQCNYCTKIFFSESRLGTSNLKRHLSTCAKRSSVPITGSDKEVDQGVYREKLAMAIMRHGYPFSSVEHEGNNTTNLSS
jgi:BED zinc finger